MSKYTNGSSILAVTTPPTPPRSGHSPGNFSFDVLFPTPATVTQKETIPHS